MFTLKTLAAACGLAAVSSGHILMATPARFTTPQATNGPLAADGSNFPCQIPAGGSFSGPVTNMALGSRQPLSFTGSATHGGGSCQVSLTTDTNPTKNSVWRVIHSIQGGCPAQGQAGNIGDDASEADPYLYSFPIPSDIPTGNYTLSWSWVNRIGNREFYQNCAAVALTGSSTGSKSNFDALPTMATANIGNGCKTTENFNYIYPDPGNSVENLGSPDQTYRTLDGTCGTYKNTALPVGSGAASNTGVAATGGAAPTASAGSGSSSSSSSASTTTSAPAAGSSSTTSSSLPGGVFLTVPTGGASGTVTAAATTATGQSTVVSTTTSTTLTTVTSSVASAPSASSGSSGSSSSSGNGTGSTGTAGQQTAGSSCTTGTWNCLGSSYQQCGSGIWSPVMQMAAGTVCSPVGQSAAINVAANRGSVKRSGRGFMA